MNVSSETLPYPVNHHHANRRVLPTKHSSMLVSASPVAVNNKIRAIQTRKPRINLQSFYDFTDIRPLNLGQQSRISNSTNAFSNLSPEKLVERSKELRLGRLVPRQNPRISQLSSNSIANQQSLIWPSYDSPTAFFKQSQVDSMIISSTAVAPTITKSPMPDIHPRSNRTVRAPLIEQQMNLVPIDSRNKSVPKRKNSIPKAYDRTISKVKSPYTSSNAQPLPMFQNDYFKQFNNNMIQIYESEEEDEEAAAEEEENTPLVMDEEFQRYVQKAIVKCADWLIKYVFDKTYDEVDE
jgi:hypothetical protein